MGVSEFWRLRKKRKRPTPLLFRAKKRVSSFDVKKNGDPLVYSSLKRPAYRYDIICSTCEIRRPHAHAHKLTAVQNILLALVPTVATAKLPFFARKWFWYYFCRQCVFFCLFFYCTSGTSNCVYICCVSMFVCSIFVACPIFNMSPIRTHPVTPN